MFFIRILLTKTMSTDVLTLPPHAARSPPKRFFVALPSICAPMAPDPPTGLVVQLDCSRASLLPRLVLYAFVSSLRFIYGGPGLQLPTMQSSSTPEIYPLFSN